MTRRDEADFNQSELFEMRKVLKLRRDLVKAVAEPHYY